MRRAVTGRPTAALGTASLARPPTRVRSGCVSMVPRQLGAPHLQR